MKVALLGELSPRQIGAVASPGDTFVHPATWISNLCLALSRQQGIEVHLISQTNEVSEDQEYRQGNVVYHFIRRPRRWRAATLFLLDRQRIEKTLRRIEPDIVHAQGTEEYGLAAVSGRRPSVLTLHGIRREESKWLSRSFFSRWTLIRWVEAYCIHKAKHIIAISPYVERWIASGTQAEIYPVENCIADAYFAGPRAVPLHRLLYVGTIEPRKNLLLLLNAFIRARQVYPELCLEIIGPFDHSFPEYRRRVEELLRDAKHLAGIHWAGWMTPDQVRVKMRESGVLCLPSRQETAPMVVAEAMASGLVVIASKVGGIPDMVDDGREGFLVERDNEDQLVEAICQIQASPDVAHAMSRRAMQSARRYHSTRIAEKTLDVYSRILQKQAGCCA